MMTRKLGLALCASLLALAAPAGAQAGTPDQAQVERAVQAMKASLHPQTGSIALPGAKVRLELGQSYYFLAPEDARKVLVDAWGNPPGSAEGVLGMVFPAGRSFDDSWGAVISYEETGHISDEDAASEDYASVLKDMQQAAEDSNEETVKQGYPASHVIGWAQAPSYDPSSKTLIWARNIKFDSASENTLNYDVRSLGRTGVLSLNMVDGMSHLPEVRAAAGQLGKTVRFDSGARYADFKPGTDQVADYGLAGLVAAGAGLGVAKKAGLIGLLAVFFKKAIALVIAAVVGLGTWLRRKFGGGYRADEDEQQP